MLHKYRKAILLSRKLIFLLLIFLTIFLPVLTENLTYNSSKVIENYDNFNIEALNPNQITKDNYSAILRGEKYGLGNITIDNIRFNDYIKGFFLNI